MAQRTEKEETEFKVVPETLTLCVNNCGLTGNPATNNLCQKCFNKASSSESSRPAASLSLSSSSHQAESSTSSSRSTSFRSPTISVSEPPLLPTRDLKRPDRTEEAIPAKREVNRCSGCRRKVGLTGFRCRCGDLFCADHRYSDRHDCSYDYKAAGREAIARENPVVKAAKIVKL